MTNVRIHWKGEPSEQFDVSVDGGDTWHEVTGPMYEFDADPGQMFAVEVRPRVVPEFVRS